MTHPGTVSDSSDKSGSAGEAFPPANQVADTWGLTFRGAPSAFRLHQIYETTDGRRYVLKRVREREFSPDRRRDPSKRDEGIARMEMTLRALRDLNGALDETVARLVVPVPLAGSPERLLLHWGDRVYHLSEFVRGARPSYRNLPDVYFLIEGLAALHKAGRSLLAEQPQSLEVPARLSLRDQMRGRLQPYRELFDQIESPPDGSMAWRVLRIGRKRIRKLVELSESMALRLESTESTPTVIHGDTHENNFLLDTGDQGVGRQCWLLDVESFRAGFAAEDLAVPFWYLARYRRYDIEQILTGLGIYSANAALDDAERRFLLANLVLPRVWFRAADRMLKEHRHWASPKCLQRLAIGLRLLRPTERFAEAVREGRM